MSDPAPEIHDLLRRRRSPVSFSERPVETEKLRSLLEAARWAPSSFNEQPWRFIVATRDDPERFGRLLGCLVEGNKEWAHRAAVLMLSVAKLKFDRSGKDNRHAFHDVGLSVENMVIQAVSMGLAAHQMAGFNVEKAREDLGIPPGFDPVAMIAIGYQGDKSVLSEKLRAREEAPRTRKPLHELAFAGRWNEPLKT